MWDPSRRQNQFSDPGDSGTRSHAALVVLDTPFAKPGVLVVAAAGDINVKTAGGEDITIPGVPVGVLPLEVTLVRVAGTTATIACVLF